ncbi:exported hypothetical protein [Candidatus Magnetomoraceae bacterium gMMP-15]
MKSINMFVFILIFVLAGVCSSVQAKTVALLISTSNNTEIDNEFIPMEPVSGSSVFNLKPKVTLNYYRAWRKKVLGQKKRVRGALRISIHDDFDFSLSKKDYISFDDEPNCVLVKDIYSPYFYTLSRANGNLFQVYSKNNISPIYNKSLGDDFIYSSDTFNDFSVEYSRAGFLAFAFLLRNNKIGIFTESGNGKFEFKKLNGGNELISAFTIGLNNRKDRIKSLIYLRNGEIKCHALLNNTNKDADNDPVIVRDDNLIGIEKATLLWHTNQAVLLGRGKGLFWSRDKNNFKELYAFTDSEHNEYHIDTFNSGEGRHFGFIWSGRVDKTFKAWLCLPFGKNGMNSFDLSDQLQTIMKFPSEHALPIFYLKDTTQWLSELRGILIYITKSNNTSVKEVKIEIPGDSVPSISEIRQINTYEFNISQNDLVVFDPKKTKSIVYIDQIEKDGQRKWDVIPFYQFKK